MCPQRSSTIRDDDMLWEDPAIYCRFTAKVEQTQKDLQGQAEGVMGFPVCHNCSTGQFNTHHWPPMFLLWNASCGPTQESGNQRPPWSPLVVNILGQGRWTAYITF